MINYSYCKKDFKDEMNNKYENYLNDREVNKIVPPNQNTSNENISNNKKKHQPAPTEYNKEEFLDEIMRIHNDVYFNPYKILEIDREYTPETLKEKYKEMALKYHPDKGGDVEVFQDITKSHLRGTPKIMLFQAKRSVQAKHVTSHSGGPLPSAWDTLSCF